MHASLKGWFSADAFSKFLSTRVNHPLLNLDIQITPLLLSLILLYFNVASWIQLNSGTKYYWEGAYWCSVHTFCQGLMPCGILWNKMLVGKAAQRYTLQAICYGHCDKGHILRLAFYLYVSLIYSASCRCSSSLISFNLVGLSLFVTERQQGINAMTLIMLPVQVKHHIKIFKLVKSNTSYWDRDKGSCLPHLFKLLFLMWTRKLSSKFETSLSPRLSIASTIPSITSELHAKRCVKVFHSGGINEA